MEPFDETDMTAEEFDELVAAGEPIETVSTRREYESSENRSPVQITSGWSGHYGSSGPQHSVVTIVTSPPAAATLQSSFQKGYQDA